MHMRYCEFDDDILCLNTSLDFLKFKRLGLKQVKQVNYSPTCYMCFI